MGPVEGAIGMDPRLRFKRDRPCPVCGGHADLPQGEGRRCYGYLSDDGRYAHCTRAEHAGRLERNGNSDAFAHYLTGDCQCGVTHGEPAPVRPLPGGSQDAPSVSSYRDARLGQPSRLWPYRHADGELAGYVARWDRPGGGKEIRPLVLRDGRWRQKGIDKPRPLYNLPELGERPDAPVLVVEGEKTSDAAGRLFASHVPTTSIGGAKAPRYSDWKPLEGREVVIWPDNDGDGQQYAEAVAALVLEAGASSARIVQLCLKAFPRIGTWPILFLTVLTLSGSWQAPGVSLPTPAKREAMRTGTARELPSHRGTGYCSGPATRQSCSATEKPLSLTSGWTVAVRHCRSARRDSGGGSGGYTQSGPGKGRRRRR